MNLVIGNSSQLAHYFPNNYIKISSRNIDFNLLKNNLWNSVYITFAEQRIYNQNIDYITPNYMYTLKIINTIIDNCQKIICYSTCELWNDLIGEISPQTPFKFFPINNEYTISKLLIWNKINELRILNKKYNKVVFMHPFYFNSVRRSEYFLFGKIFKSIIQKKKIEVGNLDFYRDMVHTKFVVEKSIELDKDSMIGSGQLFNVRQFVIDLYKLNDMKFEDYVKEDLSITGGKEKLITAKVNWNYTYENLLADTQNDILAYQEHYGHDR